MNRWYCRASVSDAWRFTETPYNSTLVAQFDIPVGKIDKMPPAFVLRRGKRNLDEWPPLGPLRFTDQVHVRFLRKSVAFACIARNTRANHVFPGCHSAAIARHNVVEIQIIAIKNLTAILACILVALEDVVTRELYFLFRQPIEKEQNDHARHANLPRDRRDHLVFRRGRGKIAPALKIVRHEIIGFIRRNNMGMACVNQRKRAPGRADIHRLPEAVQH